MSTGGAPNARARRGRSRQSPAGPPAALLALVRRFGLPEQTTGRLAALVDLVSGDEHAPTTVRDADRIIEDHLADSLVALELEQVRAARAIVDLGSGAGFPGLPLAVALPRSAVSLLESNARRCVFLQRAVAAAEAANCEIVTDRAESWRAGLGAHDLVTARAVAPLPVVLEYAAPLLRVGGNAVLWRGRSDAQAEVEAEDAARELGLEMGPRVRVSPYPRAIHRYLYVFSKVRDTPSEYPRRPGMALKRPLRGKPASDRQQR